jgi:hypothetical protein
MTFPSNKRSILHAFALIVILLLIMAQPAEAWNECVIEPIPPIGCSWGDAYCICDEDGECYWVWECSND